MISIQKLRFAYPDRRFQLAMDDWQVDDGSQVAIVGPSGSGKTTLLHLLAGILLPISGSVQLGTFGISSASEPKRRDFRVSQVGLIFQQFELLDYLTVRQNILLPFRINRSLKRDAEHLSYLEQLTTRTGIQHLLNQSVLQLSQGERQRVAICRALITRPRWILADEPTGNLDPENKQVIVDLLQQQAREANATLLMVTHDTKLVDAFPTQVDFQQWRRTSANQEAPQ